MMAQITSNIPNRRDANLHRTSFAVYKDRLNLLSQIDALESVVLPTLRTHSRNPTSRQALQEAEARLAELKDRLDSLQLD